MRLFLAPLSAALLGALAACSPALNWRDVRVEPTGLSALLPCKPDRGSREVPLGGQPTLLHMVGCDAAGATFALAHAELTDASQAAAALAGWRSATLANMQGQAHGEQPAVVAGGMASAQALRVRAQGRNALGKAVQSEALYFSQGRRVFQAVVYAQRLTPEMTDTFFQSLKLQ